eukprot:g3111.t1
MAYAPVGGAGGGGGGGGGSGGGGFLSSWCGCDAVNELIYGVDPEEKQRRAFFKNKAPTLTAGLLFRLVSTEQKEGGLGAKIGGWFSGGGKKKQQGKAPMDEQDVWVCCDDLFERLEWRTMQNVDGGKPKDAGTVALSRVKEAKKEAGSGIITLVDHKEHMLLQIEAMSEADCNMFLLALNECLSVMAGELEASRTEEEQRAAGVVAKMQKWKRLEDRKAEAAAKKKALGNVGMRYTAQAMMNKPS